MTSQQDEVSSTEGQQGRRCPKTGRIISPTSSSHPGVRRHGKIVGLVLGLGALLWFLVRVIPKPSRATYPCQRVAAPLASGFVIWLTGWGASLVAVINLRQRIKRHPFVVGAVCAAVVLTVTLALVRPQTFSAAASVEKVFNFTPAPSNVPLGVARGIFPGRVVWTHDPSATHWSGDKKSPTDQWWTDQSTDQAKVDVMLSTAILKLTGKQTEEQAWDAIFRYNNNARGLKNRGYRPGEIVAIKINLNDSRVTGVRNYTNTSPQLTLAMVHQLVRYAHVQPQNIIVYDARRDIFPGMLTKLWSEYKDLRFLQQDPPNPVQPKNPGYGDYHGLEAANWVQGVTYSANNYNEAKLIPKQILDASYIVNLAILKAHSYPYSRYTDGGDDGQTGITMTGKNQFGSIKGTAELHEAINTLRKGTKNAYSPIVDLAASPNLGAKTILYALDGLYCARKHMSFPIHFPNPPFNNRVVPYENPEWPSSVLVSLDGVALDSVGLDILYSQSKNNNDPADQNHPRILLRENSDDYLREEALASNPPSGTIYMQGGKRVTSLGVFEHWDSDATRRYSRNKSKKGKGIELLYFRTDLVHHK